MHVYLSFGRDAAKARTQGRWRGGALSRTLPEVYKGRVVKVHGPLQSRGSGAGWRKTFAFGPVDEAKSVKRVSPPPDPAPCVCGLRGGRGVTFRRDRQGGRHRGRHRRGAGEERSTVAEARRELCGVRSIGRRVKSKRTTGGQYYTRRAADWARGPSGQPSARTHEDARTRRARAR